MQKVTSNIQQNASVIIIIFSTIIPLQLSLKSEKVNQLAGVIPRSQIHHVPAMIKNTIIPQMLCSINPAGPCRVLKSLHPEVLLKSELPGQAVMPVWTWLNPYTFTYEAKVKSIYLFLINLKILIMDF